ncbi:outer membrane lipoprotein-sorting protein [Prosthecobacter fluviatilis]|uniref:Outer membrane lipoprotein-sorting protein n=1 Tax=Prosthecobacter fluviatilis TaxID=445931 RepID=A0ABW0KTF1_9BACT
MKHLYLLPLLLLAPVLRAEEAQPKTAEEIIRIVQNSYALQNYKMNGQLRDDATGRVEPMTLTMQDRVMRFLFKNPPPEIVHLDMNTSPATLYQVRQGGSSVVPTSQHGNKVRGMEFNYEDLSLGFLYWPRPQLMGDDRVSGQKCWRVRVTNPSKDGPYHAVDLWVHQGSGGAAKMAAWDRNSKIVKRYQVTKVQKVEGATTLKELRIETINPADDSVIGRTYMTLEDPVKNN